MKLLVLLLAWVPVAAHADSVTVEAGIGVGEQLGVTAPGAALGIGGWIAPNLALTARVAALTLAPEPSDPTGPVRIDSVRRTYGVAGPSLQYWFDDHFWLGAGIGLAAMLTSVGDLRGLGADVRAGYAIGSFDLSFEVLPIYFPSGGGIDGSGKPTSATMTGIALLAGYQFR